MTAFREQDDTPEAVTRALVHELDLMDDGFCDVCGDDLIDDERVTCRPCLEDGAS